MQLNLNRDVAEWLDSVRGCSSRQQYITIILRQHMLYSQDTETTKGTYETQDTNGAIDALPQI